MSKTANKVGKEPRYTRRALLESREFSGYQRDFLGAVLTQPEYTMTAAKQAVEQFFGKG